MTLGPSGWLRLTARLKVDRLGTFIPIASQPNVFTGPGIRLWTSLEAIILQSIIFIPVLQNRELKKGDQLTCSRSHFYPVGDQGLHPGGSDSRSKEGRPRRASYEHTIKRSFWKSFCSLRLTQDSQVRGAWRFHVAGSHLASVAL